MTLPTWARLRDYHCTSARVSTKPSRRENNPYYEDFSCRRYNYSPVLDRVQFRLVFLKEVLSEPHNKTLIRNGRFIWCSNLQYEGRDEQGYRKVSFTVDKGQKRFVVAENNMLCVPSNIFINNNQYFRTKDKTFSAFSSVFSYKNCVSSMAKSGGYTTADFNELISEHNPFKPGALVSPRVGYFFPDLKPGMEEVLEDEHPYGIILGPSFLDDFIGREFYRARFGSTTYERVHPIQLEIINEV